MPTLALAPKSRATSTPVPNYDRRLIDTDYSEHVTHVSTVVARSSPGVSTEFKGELRISAEEGCGNSVYLQVFGGPYLSTRHGELRQFLSDHDLAVDEVDAFVTCLVGLVARARIDGILPPAAPGAA